MNLTPIFPAHIKPVRKGVYKVANLPGVTPTNYAHWNGSSWGFYAHSVEDACDERKFRYGWQDKYWQGVLK